MSSLVVITVSSVLHILPLACSFDTIVLATYYITGFDVIILILHCTGRPKVAWKTRLAYYQKRVNTLSVINIRLRRKNEVLMKTLKLLRADYVVNQSQLDLINDGLEDILLNEVRNRKAKNQAKRYSVKICTFAFTLHYYSPKAYRYLRTLFTLPNPRTIQRWLEVVDCEPGFLTHVLDTVSSKPGPKLYSLVVDSMSIRKQTIIQNAKVYGHCDFGGAIGAADRGDKLATEALVFLLVPILGRSQYPVGFFFVDKIDSTLKSALINQCLTLTAEKSIEVVNVTCDGCPSNLATLRNLGATIPDNPEFQHPSMKHKV